MASNEAWKAIFEYKKITNHNFNDSPVLITSGEIKEATNHFKKTNQREVRILCKHDTRESRPDIFKEKDLFLLPKTNGCYYIVKGEGYVDIESINEEAQIYNTKLNFSLDTSLVGNSEMQHLDFAYASSLIRTFLEDDSLVLTIRGRKYTKDFTFNVGKFNLEVKGVQIEVDAGYEGENQVVLVEAKNAVSKNTIIRQLFYPYKQWKQYTNKSIKCLFFEKQNNNYNLWEFIFTDESDYNSIKLKRSARYIIK